MEDDSSARAALEANDDGAWWNTPDTTTLYAFCTQEAKRVNVGCDFHSRSLRDDCVDLFSVSHDPPRGRWG